MPTAQANFTDPDSRIMKEPDLEIIVSHCSLLEEAPFELKLVNASGRCSGARNSRATGSEQ